MVDSDILINGLDKIGITYTREQLNKLELYISEIELWNDKYKLVGTGGTQVIIQHVLDSLSAYPAIKKLYFKTIADVGSGAGLPGIPLSIFFPDVKFFLIERSGRRVGFLRNVVSLLNILDQVSILETGLEDVHDKFDLVLFRAFRNLVEYYPLLTEITSPGGSMFAYKGKIETIRSEISNFNKDIHIDIIPAFVPFFEGERNFLIFTQPFPDIQ